MATKNTTTPERSDDSVVLETEGLVKRFKQFLAIDRVDLRVNRGSFHSIIGPNGAGKTTLFNLITGGLPATEGSVIFNGEDITDLSPAMRVRKGIGRSFQIVNLFEGLTVRENVRLSAQSLHRDSYGFIESMLKPIDRYDDINETTEEILEQVGLAAVADETTESLPYGDKRRLEIGVVLATDPDVVMFDEPTSGMSIEDTHDTMELIDELLTDQTLLLIEHDMELVMSLSDRITVLNQGEIIAEGSPAEISQNKAVQDAYLGGMLE